MDELLNAGNNFEKSILEISKGIAKATKVNLTKAQVDEVISKKNLGVEATEDCRLIKELDLKAVKTEDSYLPSPEDMTLINKNMSLINLEPEQVRVFTFQAADDKVDRSFEHFSKAALESMAELAVKNKIPFITEGDRDHQWRQKNVYGAVYDAQVKGGKLLYKVYIPVIEKTKPILEAILTGIYSKLSVGFSLDLEDFVCDSCKKSIFFSDCVHYPGETDEKGNLVTATIKGVRDNYEISGVAVPCQQEAHIRRNSFETISIPKENTISGGGGGSSTYTFSYDGIITTTGNLPEENSTQDTINNENTIKGSVSMEENKEATQNTEEEVLETEASAEETSEDTNEEPKDVLSDKAVEAICSIADSLSDLKALKEAVEALKTLTESLNEKVDLAMSAPTKSLKENLSKEQLENAQMSNSQLDSRKDLTDEHKYWLDKFVG